MRDLSAEDLEGEADSARGRPPGREQEEQRRLEPSSAVPQLPRADADVEGAEHQTKSNGLIAQLGERVAGSHEVASSSLAESTREPGGPAAGMTARTRRGSSSRGAARRTAAPAVGGICLSAKRTLLIWKWGPKGADVAGEFQSRVPTYGPIVIAGAHRVRIAEVGVQLPVGPPATRPRVAERYTLP